MATRYGLEIRAADAADAPGLAELIAAAGGLVPARSLALRLERLLSEPHATVLVAMEWGPPSGLAVLHVRQTLQADAPVGTLSTLLVGPEARRRGVGRLLLKAAAQAARTAGCADLCLPVAPTEDALRGFCLANGFVEAGSTFVRPLRKRN